MPGGFFPEPPGAISGEPGSAVLQCEILFPEFRIGHHPQENTSHHRPGLEADLLSVSGLIPVGERHPGRRLVEPEVDRIEQSGEILPLPVSVALYRIQSSLV